MRWWSVSIFGVLFVGAPVFAVQISNVSIGTVTPSSATISWDTDAPTDATINYGFDESVGIVRDPLFTQKHHTLTIQNLDPSSLYYFRVVSSNIAGDKSATTGYVFTTKDADTLLAKKIKQEIKQLKDEKAILDVAKTVQEVANDVLRPPAIVGSPKVVVDTNGATITWSTDRESSSMVHLAADNEYNANNKDPYTLNQGSPKESTTKHEVQIVGLMPATTYHFSVSSDDATGLTGQSVDDTFETKAILPTINGVKVTRIQQTSASVEWNTGTVLAKGTVEFTNLRTKKSQTTGDPVFLNKHSVRLVALEFGTRYSAVVTATNATGDQIISHPFTFITTRDVTPPTITKVKNESTLYADDDAKVQTIVTFTTDEPAFCQVLYIQGLGGAGSKPESVQKETNPVTVHTQVIVGFAPGTVYKYWVQCEDDARNQSRSADFVLITPVREKNIIDIILENFQGTFGWVGKVGK